MSPALSLLIILAAPQNIERVNEQALSDILGEMGKRFGTYFTLEMEYVQNKPRLVERKLSSPEKEDNANMGSALSWLRDHLGGVEVLEDKNKKGVFHIVENGLIKKNGYAMEEIFEDPGFSGSADGLLSHYSKLVPSLRPETSVITTRINDLDVRVAVRIAKGRKNLREALTMGLSLDRYNRIAWQSTLMPDGKMQVIFDGPWKEEYIKRIFRSKRLDLAGAAVPEEDNKGHRALKILAGAVLLLAFVILAMRFVAKRRREHEK